jgi:hypothetical protein
MPVRNPSAYKLVQCDRDVVEVCPPKYLGLSYASQKLRHTKGNLAICICNEQISTLQTLYGITQPKALVTDVHMQRDPVPGKALHTEISQHWLSMKHCSLHRL